MGVHIPRESWGETIVEMRMREEAEEGLRGGPLDSARVVGGLSAGLLV